MTIQDLGSVGELVAAIATVATLFYLALQIRQNTNSIRSASARDVLHEAQHFLTGISSDPELLDVYMRGFADRSSLSDADCFRFDAIVMASFRNIENLVIQSKRGVLSDPDWEGLRETIRVMHQRPGIKEFLAERGGELNRDVIQFLDDLGDPRS